jgi:molybdopterin molybdotransferase
LRELTRDADWIGLEAAIARILDAVALIGPEDTALDQSLGRVLAEDATSPVDLPPWHNSAMDGFAVRSADVSGAREDAPVRLVLIESVQAGGFPTLAVGKGQAIKIMTGAPLPVGADSVVRVEHTRQERNTVSVLSDADAGRNIRKRGEDVMAGRAVLSAGALLRPGEIGLLASIGQARVLVRRKPVVAILSTGDELVDVDGFEEAKAGRRIVNSNSYALAAAARATGCEPRMLGIARDERAHLHELLTQGLKADVLVTSAGASVGEHDLVKDVLEELGVRTHFWRVRIRPGSPFSFGTSPDQVPVFGLPGNPVSALVTFEILVKPALRKMLGRRTLHSPVVQARLAERVTTTTGLTQFMRVRLVAEDGLLVARLTGPQGSGILSSIAHADGLMVVPEDVGELEAGATVRVVRLLAGDETQLELGFQTRMTK